MGGSGVAFSSAQTCSYFIVESCDNGWTYQELKIGLQRLNAAAKKSYVHALT